VCQYAKNCGTDFFLEILILKFLAIKKIINLDFASGTAAKISRPISL